MRLGPFSLPGASLRNIGHLLRSDTKQIEGARSAISGQQITFQQLLDNPAYVYMSANQANGSDASKQLSLETLVINSDFPSNHQALSSILEKLVLDNAEIHHDPEIKDVFEKIKNEVSISIIDTNTLNAFAHKGSSTTYISKGLNNAILNNHKHYNSADHELAFVIAHELSHLVYDKHIKKNSSNNAMSQSEEYFCDRLALELCDNAGFDIKYASFAAVKQKDQVSMGFLSSHPHSSDREFILKEIRKSNYWKHAETLIPQKLLNTLREYESGRKSPLEKILNSLPDLRLGQNQEELLLNTAKLLSAEKDEKNFRNSLEKIVNNSILSEAEKPIYLKILSEMHSTHGARKMVWEDEEFNIHQLSQVVNNLPKPPDYLQVLNAIHDKSEIIGYLNNCFSNIYDNIKVGILRVDIKSDKDSEKLLQLLQKDFLPFRFSHNHMRGLTEKLTNDHVIELIKEDLESGKVSLDRLLYYGHLTIEHQSEIKKHFQLDSKFRELMLTHQDDDLLRYVQEDISLKDILNLKIDNILPIVYLKDLNEQDLTAIREKIKKSELNDFIKNNDLESVEVTALIKLFKDDAVIMHTLSTVTLKTGYGLWDTDTNEDFNIIKKNHKQIYDELSLKEFYELSQETYSRSSSSAMKNIGQISLQKISQKYQFGPLSSEEELEKSVELVLNTGTGDLKLINNSVLDFKQLDTEELLYLSQLLDSAKLQLSVKAIALERELENFSKESFLDYINKFKVKQDLDLDLLRPDRALAEIDKSQVKTKISETLPLANYKLLDSALIRILDGKKLINNDDPEVFHFITEVLTEKSPERDFFLNQYVEISKLTDLSMQIAFVNSFYTEYTAFEQRMFIFDQELPRCSSLNENIELIQQIFSEPSKEKDELLNSAFDKYGLEFSEFNKYRQLFTNGDPKYEESRSFFSGSLKSLFICGGVDERMATLKWLTNLSDIKPKLIEKYEKENHVNADELKLLILNKSIRVEILNSLGVGESSQALFYKKNEELMNDFLKKLVDDSLTKSDYRDAKLEVLCKETLCELFKISDQNKKLNILNNLIELGLDENANLGKLICGFLGSLGAVGVKFGQTLASNIHIESKYPDLHKELSNLKENFSPMGIEQAMIALEQNPELHSNDIRIIKPLKAASLKGVFLIEFEGKEAVLKVFRPEINKNLDQEKQEFSLLLENMNPVIKDLFGIERIPNYSESIFTALKEEINIEREIFNNQMLSKILSSFSNKEVSLNTAKNFPLSNPRFIIIEEVAPGQSYESFRLNLQSEETKDSLDNLQNSCFVQSSLIHGFYHADPHRGNIFIKQEDRKPIQVTFIDSGLCGTLPKNLLNRSYMKEIINIINNSNQESFWSNLKTVPSIIKVFTGLRKDFPELKSIKPLAFIKLVRELSQNSINPALTIANWLEINSDSDQLNRLFMTMAKLDMSLIIKNINLIE